MEKRKTINFSFLKFAQTQLLFYLMFGLFGKVEAQFSFEDITDSSGINHHFRVFEGMFGGGACVFDFNRDGFEDVYLTSGMENDMLYLNKGDGTFKDVFEGSGLEVTVDYVTQGVSAADVNRDGWPDLFITTITSRLEKKVIPRSKNLFFLNMGDGTFRDATSEYGLDDINTFSTTSSFGDFNADGFPDVYIGNYFNQFTGELKEITDATIVGSNQIAKGNLLLNIDGHSFEDVYGAYNLEHKGFGFGGVFTDYDNDGDQDLLVNHDFGYKRTPNLLLENQFPKTKFIDVAKDSKMDLKINSMGTAVGDYNNDGFMDYYFTNIRFNQFLKNNGSGTPFENKTKELGFAMPTMSISWGANFADFDHDGDVDLFVANGDLNPNCVPMANFYFENSGNEFIEKARLLNVNDYGIGRGSVVFDIENDGDLDLLVVNQKPTLNYPVRSRTTLYRNEGSKGNWMKVSLEGTQAEMNGIGSKVEVIAGGLKMIREIDGGGSSHLSQNSKIAHFGLGQAESIDTIRVYWTGGETQVLINQKINELLIIKEPFREKNHVPWLRYSLLALILIVAFYFLVLRKLVNN